jgi:hypothetical protein
MVKVKPLDQIKKNYTGAAPIAAARYRDAIPTITWQDPALKGQKLFEEQMMKAEVLKRREAKIKKVPDTEFRKALEEKGAPVLSSRMAAAADKQVSHFAPYRAALEAVTLPDRTADPLTNIDNRLKAIVSALVETKKKQMAS